jgi:hypothetical protein
MPTANVDLSNFSFLIRQSAHMCNVISLLLVLVFVQLLRLTNVHVQARDNVHQCQALYSSSACQVDKRACPAYIPAIRQKYELNHRRELRTEA